jgi:hypothetical protein
MPSNEAHDYISDHVVQDPCSMPQEIAEKDAGREQGVTKLLEPFAIPSLLRSDGPPYPEWDELTRSDESKYFIASG